MEFRSTPGFLCSDAHSVKLGIPKEGHFRISEVVAILALSKALSKIRFKNLKGKNVKLMRQKGVLVLLSLYAFEVKTTLAQLLAIS